MAVSLYFWHLFFVYLSICPSVFVCLSVCLSVYLYLSLCLFVHLGDGHRITFKKSGFKTAESYKGPFLWWFIDTPGLKIQGRGYLKLLPKSRGGQCFQEKMAWGVPLSRVKNERKIIWFSYKWISLIWNKFFYLKIEKIQKRCFFINWDLVCYLYNKRVLPIENEPQQGTSYLEREREGVRERGVGGWAGEQGLFKV